MFRVGEEVVIVQPGNNYHPFWCCACDTGTVATILSNKSVGVYSYNIGYKNRHGEYATQWVEARALVPSGVEEDISEWL